jgi:hypothetical protein
MKLTVVGALLIAALVVGAILLFRELDRKAQQNRTGTK